MSQDYTSFLGGMPRRRVARVILAVVSTICIAWVALAYTIDALLSTQNGNDRQLVTTALAGAGLLVAALIAWRCGVPVLWILGVGGLAALIQLLVLFL
jgi:hypothetical protein